MKRIYTALHLPDAHIVANLLTHAGIAVRIFNANSSGALGELPVDAAQPQVWIEDDRNEDRARLILENYQHTATSQAVRPCPHCGEDNPLTFETCWHCGQSISAA
jgi:hypothetical protein